MDDDLRQLLHQLRLGHDVEEKARQILDDTRAPVADPLERMARTAAAVAVASVLCGGTHTEADVAQAAQVPEDALQAQLDRIVERVDIDLLL